MPRSSRRNGRAPQVVLRATGMRSRGGRASDRTVLVRRFPAWRRIARSWFGVQAGPRSMSAPWRRRASSSAWSIGLRLMPTRATEPHLDPGRITTPGTMSRSSTATQAITGRQNRTGQGYRPDDSSEIHQSRGPGHLPRPCGEWRDRSSSPVHFAPLAREVPAVPPLLLGSGASMLSREVGDEA